MKNFEKRRIAWLLVVGMMLTQFPMMKVEAAYPSTLWNSLMGGDQNYLPTNTGAWSNFYQHDGINGKATYIDKSSMDTYTQDNNKSLIYSTGYRLLGTQSDKLAKPLFSDNTNPSLSYNITGAGNFCDIRLDSNFGTNYSAFNELLFYLKSYNGKTLWDYMSDAEKDELTVTMNWGSPYVATYYLRRKVVHFGGGTFSGAQAVGSNYYYNVNNKNVNIKVNFTNTFGIEKEPKVYIRDAAVDSLSAYLCVGNGKDGVKVCDLKVSKSGTGINLTGTIPDDFTSNGDGMYLYIQATGNPINLYIQDPGNLYCSIAKETINGQTFEENTAGRYFSNYKVDTKAPTYSLVDKTSNTVNISNTWSEKKQFNIVSSEELTNGKVTYKLMDGTTPISITNYQGTSGNSADGQEVPVGTAVINNAQVNLALTDKVEGKYKLVITGQDTALNESTQEIDNVFLDNKAPSITVTTTPQSVAVDGSKSTEYKFNISDASGTGKVYYQYVADNSNGTNTAPSVSTSAPWKFVELGAATTTAVLKAEVNQNIKGKLYYYTVDDSGNSSYVDEGKLFSQDVAIYNKQAQGEVTVSDETVGLPRYNITFDNKGDSTNQLQYRWVDKNTTPKFTSSSFKIYNGEDDIGSQNQEINDNVYVLDGNYDLEYKIVNTTSGNTTETFTKRFVFDNSDPKIEIPVWSNGTKVRETQPVTIKISDYRGLESAYCQIVDLNNNPIEGLDRIDLTIGSNGVLGEGGSQTINLTVPNTDEQSGTGIYGIKIYAKDLNGNVKEVAYNYSNGTHYYNDSATYKNSAMRFFIRTDKPTLSFVSTDVDLYDEKNERYVVKDDNYTITVKAQEVIKNSEALNYKTFVKYQTSVNGTTWSVWKDANTSMLFDGDTNYGQFDITNPCELANGDNTIYVRVATFNFDLANDTDRTNELNTNVDAKFISAPISVKIAKDNAAANYKLTYQNEGIRTKNDTYATLEITNPYNKQYSLTSNSENVTYEKVESEDNYNITYKITIKDSISSSNTLVLQDNFGVKTNIPLNVTWVDKIAPIVIVNSNNQVESGIRKDAELNITISDYKDGTLKLALVKTGYSISDSDYTRFNEAVQNNQIEVTEIKSNANYGEVNNTITLKLRGLTGDYQLGYKAEDILGNSVNDVISGTGVVLKDEEASYLSDNTTFNPIETSSYTEVSLKFSTPVIILAQTKDNADTILETIKANAIVSEDSKFKTNYNFSLYKDDLDENQQKVYYICDQLGRAKKITVDASSVRYIDGYKFNCDYTLNGVSITPSNDNWIGLNTNNDMKVIITPNASYDGQYFALTTGSAITTGINGVKLNTDESVLTETPPEELKGYTLYDKLVFDILMDSDSTSRKFDFISFTKNGDLDILSSQQLENIMLKNIDSTPAKIEYKLSTDKLTNQDVTAYITVSDNESGVSEIYEMIDGNYVKVNDGNSFNRIITSNDDIKYIYAVNNAGLVTTSSAIQVSNIDKEPIVEGVDYSVKYYYQKYDDTWAEIVDGNYYKAVKAVIIPNADSKKILSILNNNQSFEKILTNATPFEFNIGDVAGNTTICSVTYNKYETEAPAVQSQVSPLYKTNKPVTITLTGQDKQTDIAHCELYYKNNNTYEKVEVSENSSTNVNGLFTKTYTASVIKSGEYVAYLWDEAGNKAVYNFDVTNVDARIPVLGDIEYSTTKLTSQTVFATIKNFVKDNDVIDASKITILSVEPIGTLTNNDIIYTPSSKGIRFKKNGSVGISFKDEYGNVSEGIITVENIKTTPPQCVPVVTLDSSLAYARVSFVSAEGANEDLDLVYVTYGAYRDTATNASVKIIENGTYSFIIQDEVGNTATVKVEVSGIDKVAPKITSIKWNYDYLVKDENTGKWVSMTENNEQEITDETNYNLTPDKLSETNQDVSVTVTTDKEIVQIGSSDNSTSFDKTFIYDSNGVFSFNLQSVNGTNVLFPVDVELIDKDKPVIEFNNSDELIFIENDKRQDTKYDKSKLYDFVAYDMKDGKKIDITSNVEIDFAVNSNRPFNPDDISKNEFNRNKPYYIKYKVTDSVGNVVEVTRTVRLIGVMDTVALINGQMPNTNNMISVNSGDIVISLKNNSGKVYAKYSQGMKTMGEMKYQGKGIQINNDGTFSLNVTSSGWYTISVQTDKKDFFNIYVYVSINK